MCNLRIHKLAYNFKQQDKKGEKVAASKSSKRFMCHLIFIIFPYLELHSLSIFIPIRFASLAAKETSITNGVWIKDHSLTK